MAYLTELTISIISEKPVTELDQFADMAMAALADDSEVLINTENVELSSEQLHEHLTRLELDPARFE